MSKILIIVLISTDLKLCNFTRIARVHVGSLIMDCFGGEYRVGVNTKTYTIIHPVFFT